MSHQHGRATEINGKRRYRCCGHRTAVDGVAPRETRQLVLEAGLAGVGVVIAELRDRRRARLVGKWTRTETAA